MEKCEHPAAAQRPELLKGPAVHLHGVRPPAPQIRNNGKAECGDLFHQVRMNHDGPVQPAHDRGHIDRVRQVRVVDDGALDLIQEEVQQGPGRFHLLRGHAVMRLHVLEPFRLVVREGVELPSGHEEVNPRHGFVDHPLKGRQHQLDLGRLLVGIQHIEVLGPLGFRKDPLLGQS